THPGSDPPGLGWGRGACTLGRPCGAGKGARHRAFRVTQVVASQRISVPSQPSDGPVAGCYRGTGQRMVMELDPVRAAACADRAALAPRSPRTARGGLECVRARPPRTRRRDADRTRSGADGDPATSRPARFRPPARRDLRFPRGRARARLKPPERLPSTVVATGRSAAPWQRRPDGAWKMAVDIGNADARRSPPDPGGQIEPPR